MSPVSSMRGTILLCDWAEVIGGKLYAQGIGWTGIAASQPVQFAVACLIRVPYSRTNEKHAAAIKLLTDDGQEFPADNPIAARFDFEVGRPPGMRAGDEQTVPFAFKIGGITLNHGGFAVELYIDDEQCDTTTFVAR